MYRSTIITKGGIVADVKKTNTANAPDNTPVFSWEAREFTDYKKNGSWFAIVIVVAIALAAYFIWQKNWTATGVVVAASFALIAQSRAKPKKVKCEVFRSGIVVDEKAYPYETLKSFWVLGGDHPKVRLEQTSRFKAPINMPIADEDPEQIRLFLAKKLPENEDQGEDFTDTVSRWLRF